ncbi:M15 family metallopeptidase [Gordonia araii NBRC 100433]|nr:M15 family metallopeptidase [Gordonia araii NBRC 100433]
MLAAFAAVLAVVLATPAVFAATASAAPSSTAGLTPQLATAYRLAKAQANREGVPLWITSGKRSWAEQNRLWREGIRTHGSPAAARRWVLPPAESSHVIGRAIDVGPLRGARWLARTGNRWGLCRTYANEWWHFEVATFPGTPCPPMRPSAAHR